VSDSWPELPPEVARRLDEACNRFEAGWHGAVRPRLEDFLPGLEDELYPLLLRELVLLDVYYRRQAGEQPHADDYRSRFASLDAAWLAQALTEDEAGTFSAGAPSGEEAPSDTPPESMTADRKSRCLDDYEQLSEIARGGMGVVYKAFDPRLQRWVALKQVRLEHASPNLLARFRQEAVVLARLTHPHIVKLHGQHGSNGHLVLEMEYVAGSTLEQRLIQGPVAPEQAARLVAILAWAVHAAHEKGIVHRDLKPANVLLDEPVEGNPGTVLDGFPKISDFGLAALVDPGSGQTLSGAVLGTPAYMSPEQAAGKTREVGPATDVWALGVILYRCLTGVLPFAGDSVLDTLEQIKTAPVRPVRELRPEVPAVLEEVCLACLNKVPGERPMAAALAAQLDRLAGHAEAAKPGRWSRARPRRRRALWWTVAAVAAALVLGGLAAGLWFWPKGPVDTSEPAVKLRVLHWEHDRGEDFKAGPIHAGSLVRFDDRVVIEVELWRPGHCYLIAFNADGKEQLLWPCDEEHLPHRPDATRAPPERSRLQYPPPPRVGRAGEAAEPNGFRLNDNKAGGMQAFLVAASRRPLPPYQKWARQRGRPPWQHQPPAGGVWGATLGWQDDSVRLRGDIVALVGQPPLARLCDWARGDDVEVVEAMAFGVFPQRDR
jgi:hypothetical protein